jgi:hypothetical protein
MNKHECTRIDDMKLQPLGEQDKHSFYSKREETENP